MNASAKLTNARFYIKLDPQVNLLIQKTLISENTLCVCVMYWDGPQVCDVVALWDVTEKVSVAFIS